MKLTFIYAKLNITCNYNLHVGLVVTYLSYGSPGSFVRVHEICKSLTNLGIHCTILTPFEEDVSNIDDVSMELIPSGFAKVGLSSNLYHIASKLMTSRIGMRLLFSKISFDRIIKSLSVGLSQILQKADYDIVHAIQPHSGIACSAICEKLRIPLVTDLHNITGETLVADGLARINDESYKRVHEMEQQVINSSNAITVVSDTMKYYISRNFHVKHNNIIVVPPGGPLLEAGFNIQREPIVIYAGTVHPREHVDLFANSIPHIRANAHFFISSKVSGDWRTKKIINTSTRDINYFWFRKREEVLNLLVRSKIGVLTSRDDVTRQLGPPLKLYDYLACGLPVVSNDIGGWSRMIADEKIGIITKDDPLEFAAAIDELLTNNALWQEMHHNALELIRCKYNWNTIVESNLVPLYRNLAKDNIVPDSR